MNQSAASEVVNRAKKFRNEHGIETGRREIREEGRSRIDLSFANRDGGKGHTRDENGTRGSHFDILEGDASFARAAMGNGAVHSQSSEFRFLISGRWLTEAQFGKRHPISLF